jgi:hypothetical protein
VQSRPLKEAVIMEGVDINWNSTEPLGNELLVPARLPETLPREFEGGHQP